MEVSREGPGICYDEMIKLTKVHDLHGSHIGLDGRAVY